MYTAKKIKEIENGKGYWSYQDVGIFKDDVLIGQYRRNYNSYVPFAPFTKDGKDFALYSMNYTATRLMSLPGCIDLCGESWDTYGFCPVEMYVPPRAEGKFGFISGCVWGDDSGGWKLMYVDLLLYKDGKYHIDITPKFGYLMLPCDLETYVEDNYDILSKEVVTEEDIAKLPKYEDDEEEEVMDRYDS